MSHCEYTNHTDYMFHSPLCKDSDNTNYVGVANSDALEKALSCKPGSDKWVQLFVPKIFDIPTQKPSMEGIVSVNSCVDIISQRVIRTPVVTGYTDREGTFIPGDTIPNGECLLLTGKKLVIEGVITQKVIYTALEANQALHSATFRIPFSTFIIVEGDRALTEEFRIYPYLEDVYTNMLSERTIFSNNTLFIKAAAAC